MINFGLKLENWCFKRVIKAKINGNLKNTVGIRSVGWAINLGSPTKWVTRGNTLPNLDNTLFVFSTHGLINI
jgi:hypothetical protein